jgi:uncharacterized protein YraI
MSSRIIANLPAVLFAASLPVLLAAGAAAQSPSEPQQAALSPADASATTSPLHAVSLRSGPGGEYPVIGTIRQGTPTEILAAANHGWLQVRSSAGEGWAWGAYFPGGAALGAQAGTTPAEISSP